MPSEEAGRVAAATARTKMVERAYREVSRQDERSRTDRERLEMIARGKPEPDRAVVLAKSGCGKLSRAYCSQPKPDGAASLAISPPSDIVLDVARAAEPTTLETARARLASRAGAAAGLRRSVLARRPQEFAARAGTSRPMQTDAQILRGFRGDGAADLRAVDDAEGRRKTCTARAWPATCGNR